MNIDKDLFGAFAFYAGIVTIKMMVMSLLTIKIKLKVGVFTTPEDVSPVWKAKGYKVKLLHKSFIFHFQPYFDQ